MHNSFKKLIEEAEEKHPYTRAKDNGNFIGSSHGFYGKNAYYSSGSSYLANANGVTPLDKRVNYDETSNAFQYILEHCDSRIKPFILSVDDVWDIDNLLIRVARKEYDLGDIFEAKKVTPEMLVEFQVYPTIELAQKAFSIWESWVENERDYFPYMDGKDIIHERLEALTGGDSE